MAANLPSLSVPSAWSLPAVAVAFTGPDSMTLRVSGDLDAFGIPALQMGLDGIWAHDVTRVTVDLTGVTFLGVAGLHALLRARATADRRAARLTLRVGSGHMARILEVAGAAEIPEQAGSLVSVATGR
jgi:anti-anti-sigma factor